MRLSLLLAPALALSVQGTSFSRRDSSWPYAPFTTFGRDIRNNLNESVVYAGVNWPGAAEVMISEGLQYQSVSTILSKIKSLGMNVIRLTYAIEMVDDIYAGADSSLKNALITALGTENGTTVLGEILDKNPSFTENTTRLEVYDAVAAEALNQEIYIHLDNHVSKGEWCCSHDDGNAWFGDVYFNVSNWQRGLAYMASHGSSWPALVSMSLRNELRSTDNASNATAAYDWASWYTNMIPAANGINAANPTPLIFFSGLNYDTDLSDVVTGSDLGNGTTFNLTTFSYADKIVFELHNYDNDATDCSSITSALYNGGYIAMNATVNVNHAPVVLTEFGFLQDNATYAEPYAQCIREYLTGLDGGPGGWMQWDVAGSYYTREGAQDVDETWGLLDHEWENWRSVPAVNYTKVFVEETLS